MMASTNLFWRPGQEKPGSSVKTERHTEGVGAGSFIAYNSNVSLSVQQQRQRLPVFKYRNHILFALEKYQTLVISGSTGSGKSTQIPQYLYESGWTNEEKIIAITQPRRVAVTTVADRVAEEMGTFVGQEVGYSMRFDNCSDEIKTKIRFMTDGYLVREMMSDPLLSKYSVIMLDEVHERTLHTDIVIGLLKKILKKRQDLKLIVSSATLDVNTFRDFFNLKLHLNQSKDTTFVMCIEGRSFPVDIFYLQNPAPDYIKASVQTVVNIHQNEGDGDILVFLTGQAQVEQMIDLIEQEVEQLNKNKKQLLALPLYGGLPMSEQLKVFQRTPRDKRKVVVSTNVAEASVTINGIVYVVDCGFVKLRTYNSTTGLDSLVIVPVSKASADQRAGRAGRVRSGKTFRLYSEKEYDKFDDFTVPEVQRSNLTPVILQLKSLGIVNIVRFSFLNRPPAQQMVQGCQLLYALEALDDNADLTDPLGIQMAEFPLDPMLSKMLLCSGDFGCSEEAVTLAAMLQIENCFVSLPNKKNAILRKKLKFSVEEGDHLTLINVYRAFVQNGKHSKWCHENFLNYKALCRVERIRYQLISLLKQYDIPIVSCDDDDEIIRKCILSGFFANVACYHPSGEYRTIRDDHPLHLHPRSVLATNRKPPKYVVFHQVMCTSKDFMRDVTVVKLSWILESAPSYYKYSSDVVPVSKKSKVDDD